jgi:hypothetical protein
VEATDGIGSAGHYAPKHCIVQFGSSFSPGVVLGWRKNVRGLWEAQVMYAHGGGTSRSLSMSNGSPSRT